MQLQRTRHCNPYDSSHEMHSLRAIRSPLSALRSPLSALRSALCALRSPLSALRSALSALRSPLCALRSALCALRFYQQKKEPTANAMSSKIKVLATTYSPGRLPSEYHRRKGA